MPIPLGVLAVAGAGGGAAANSFDLLETTLISTNTASVTFTNLNAYSDYKHLQLRATVRTDRASTVDVMTMTINSDTGANYSDHYLRGDGSIVESGSGASQNNMEISFVAGNTATANLFGSLVIDFLDFANTNKAKTFRSFSGTTGTLDFIALNSGRWGSTSAITSISLDQDSGSNFVSGCRFSLYGIK